MTLGSVSPPPAPPAENPPATGLYVVQASPDVLPSKEDAAAGFDDARARAGGATTPPVSARDVRLSPSAGEPTTPGAPGVAEAKPLGPRCSLQFLEAAAQSEKVRVAEAMQAESAAENDPEDRWSVVQDEHVHGDLVQALKVLQAQHLTHSRGSPAQLEDHFKFGLLVDEENVEVLLDEALGASALKATLRLDSISGVAVVANGVMMGITADRAISDDSLIAVVLDYCFLAFFIAEWAIRLHYNPRGLYGMLTDRWTAFDAFVISISVFDTAMSFTGTESGTSMLAVFRIVRLLRLIRLVKLLKLLKELWLLVNGMMTSINILSWAVFLLLVVCYMFSIMMFSVAPKKTGSDDPNYSDERMELLWGSIIKSMVSLLQIATYNDGWSFATLMEEAPLTGLVFVVFSSITAMGILNLIVGLLLVSALQIVSHDTVYESNTERLQRHMAIRNLKTGLDFMAAERAAETDGNPKEISRRLLRNLHQDQEITVDRTVVESWMLAGPLVVKDVEVEVTSRKFPEVFAQPISFPALFAAAGVTLDHINVVLNELQSIVGKDAKVTVDDFMTGCLWLKEHVHQLNGLVLTSGLNSAYQRLCYFESMLSEAATALSSSNAYSSALLAAFHAPSAAEASGQVEKEEAIAAASRERAPTHLETGHDRMAADKERLRKERIHNDLEMKWHRFDVFFLVFVALNAVVVGIGMETGAFNEMPRNPLVEHFNATAKAWFLIEHFFFFVFSLEFCLRACIYYQLEVQGDVDGTFWIIFPANYAWDFETISGTVLSVPKMVFQDVMSTFDATLVFFSLADNVMFRYREGGGIVLVCIRLFRLMRIVRVIRVLHLVPSLYIITESLISTIPLLFWVLLTMTGISYMGAIVMMELVAKNESVDPDEEWLGRWQSMGKSMLTLIQITTFDDWVARISEVAETSEAIRWFLLGYVLLTSLNLLNLATGIMVQAAVAMQKTKRTHETQQATTEAKCALNTTRDSFMREIETRRVNLILTRQSMRQARSLSSQTSMSSLVDGTPSERRGPEADETEEGSEQGGETSRNFHPAHAVADSAPPHPIGPTGISCDQLMLILDNEHLQRELKKIHITLDQALMIFQKMDVLALGCVDINDFVTALLKMKPGVDGLDIAHAKSMMRRMVFSTVHLRGDAARIHDLITQVVSRVRGVRVIDQDASVDQSLYQEAYTELLDAKYVEYIERNAKYKVAIKNCQEHVKARKKRMSKIAGYAPLFAHDGGGERENSAVSAMSSAPGAYE